jgi:hypothetical protein
MAISFACPHCSAKYEVADAMAGKSILCRQCEQRGQVPGPAVAAGARQAVGAGAEGPWTRRKVLKTGAALAVPMALWAAFAYYWQGAHPPEIPRRQRPPNTATDNAAGNQDPAGANPGGPPGQGGRGGRGGRGRRGGGGGAPPGPIQ